jgi:DNA-binding NarL/FixJ family response regulator
VPDLGDQKPSTSVAVIGATRFYRESLARFLAEGDGITFLGTAATPAEAAGLLAGSETAIVLFDVVRTSDLRAIHLVREVAPGARIVALGLPELESEILACAEEGIVGFVGRDRSLEELVLAIRAAARGDFECSPALSGALLRHVGTLAAAHRRAPGGVALTPREDEVGALIERGLSNKEIARSLHIELPTVKNHVHNLLEKLQVSTRGQAAAVYRTLPPRR